MINPLEHDHCQHLLGAYVLGGLEPSDRAAVEAHVAECEECRRELAEFAVVPGLLSRAPSLVPEPAAGEDPPVPALRGALLSIARQRSRRRYAAGVTGLAACTLAIGAGIGATVLTEDDPQQPQAATVAPAQRTIALAAKSSLMGGSADLAAKPWGTELRVKLHDLPARRRLKLVAVGADGRSEAAATWSVPDAGKIQLTGATSIRQEAVRRIDIRGDDGKILASSS